MKNKKGNFHELELLDVGVNKYVQDYNGSYPYNYYDTRTYSSLALRYQYQQNFLKSKSTRWMPFVSIGATAGVQHGKYSTNNPYHINKSIFTNLTYLGYLSPGVSYNISKRFFATITLPVTLFDGASYFTLEKIQIVNNQIIIKAMRTMYFVVFPEELQANLVWALSYYN